MKIKKFLFFGISFFLGLLLFFLVIKWVGWKEVKETLFTLSSSEGIIILILTFLTWIAGTLKWRFILKSLGYNLPFLTLGEIMLSGFAVSYLLTPTAIAGGEGFRVFAMRKKFPQLPWEKNLASIAIEKILSISIILLIFIFGFLSFLFLTNLPFKKFGIIIVSIIAIISAFLGFFYFKSFKKESILKWFLKFFGIRNKKNNHFLGNIEKEIFNFFELKKDFIWKGFGFTFLKYFLIFLRCWFIILFLKGIVNIFPSLVILFFMYLAYIIPFPAALGSMEISQAFAFNSLGLTEVTGITFSFILRGAEFFISLVGVLLLIKFGIKFLKPLFSNGVKNEV